MKLSRSSVSTPRMSVHFYVTVAMLFIIALIPTTAFNGYKMRTSNFALQNKRTYGPAAGYKPTSQGSPVALQSKRSYGPSSGYKASSSQSSNNQATTTSSFQTPSVSVKPQLSPPSTQKVDKSHAEWALLFDCDGVIVETEELHRQAYNSAFKEFGLKIPSTNSPVEWTVEYYDELQNTVGGGKPKMMHYFNKVCSAQMNH